MPNRNLETLVLMAMNEPMKQQLLFVFAEAQEMENSVKTRHKSGTITPLMCVDKDPSELTSFQDLVKEADSISDKWNLVFIGALGGSESAPPADEEVEKHLNKMTDFITQGLIQQTQLVVLNREEEQIVVS